MAYATAADYKALYTDTDMGDTTLGLWLAKASREIDIALLKRGAKLPEVIDGLLKNTLSDVCMDMVHRVIGSGSSSIMEGLTSYSQSANGFQETMNFATYSTLKVRGDELDAILACLGIVSGGIGYASVLGGD
jgi:hypothetical protein